MSAADQVERLTEAYEAATKLTGALDGLEKLGYKAYVAKTLENKEAMRAILAERDAFVTANGLWGALVMNHPSMLGSDYQSPCEIEFLKEHLKEVRLEEPLDERGSYELTFVLKDEAAEFVDPIVWRKKVVVDETFESNDETRTEVTKITYKDKSLDPAVYKAMILQAMPGLDTIDPPTICGWFSTPGHVGFFGELFRRAIYKSLHLSVPVITGDAEDHMTSDDSAAEDDQ